MSQKEIRINLGSSDCGPMNWINIDSDIRFYLMHHTITRGMLKSIVRLGVLKSGADDLLVPPPNFLYVDLSKGRLHFASNSVSYCYTSHFLEHLPRYRASRLMTEVYRVLKSGGRVRVVVPDLEAVARAYVQKKTQCETTNNNLLDFEYPNLATPAQKLNAYFSKFADPTPGTTGLRGTIKRVFQGFFGQSLGHHWLYDFEDLEDLLASAGFKDIRRESYGQGNFPDLCVLDIEGHRRESLYVEAEK
ncbi:MAG: methyltransferase domain-containing protein [Nitrososphaerota archaeon]|nr:methyltransferase domain-containing protein [Nitrososphaerota archaeon]